MKKVVIIIQARMTSTRLPGKVLKPILNRPMFSYQLERLRQVTRAHQIVVATTVNVTDDPIVKFCVHENVACIRGSEDDVLSRYVLAAQEHQANTVVRITSDCPLLDPELVDQLIGMYIDAPTVDYVSNLQPQTWPYGMAVEVFDVNALYEAGREATDPAEREHVTPFINRRPDRYHLQAVTHSEDLSYHRWTVDTPEDFELIYRIFCELYPEHPTFRMGDVLDVLHQNPSWVDLNSHVRQKTI